MNELLRVAPLAHTVAGRDGLRFEYLQVQYESGSSKLSSLGIFQRTAHTKVGDSKWENV